MDPSESAIDETDKDRETHTETDTQDRHTLRQRDALEERHTH